MNREIKIGHSGEVSEEFPQGKESYCPQCYFDDDKVILRKDCPHNSPMTPQDKQPGKCCEKCNINTASFSYRRGREPNEFGCLNPNCPCHTEPNNLEAWEKELAQILGDKHWEICDCDLGEGVHHCPIDVLFPKLKSFLSKVYSQSRQQALEEVERWAYENGITHKESFLKLINFLSSISNLKGNATQ